MKKAFEKGRLQVFALVAACMALASMAFASMAGAVAPEYSKLTEGVTTEFAVIIPIVLLALGTIIGIAFAIKWAVRKFGGVH